MKRKLSGDVGDDLSPSVLKRPRSTGPTSKTNDPEASDEDQTSSTSSTSSSSADDSSLDQSELSNSDEPSGQEAAFKDDASDEEPQSDSDEIMNVLLGKQPLIQPVQPSELRSRLSSFLPALAAANASLDKDRDDGKLSHRVLDQDEGHEGQYIEMNLGLGVLEEKSTGMMDTHTTSPSSSSTTEADEESGHDRASGRRKGVDLMAKLMGRNATIAKIEEVDGG